MTDSRSRVQELFHDCLALADDDARRSFLDRATRGEPTLRARVEELLLADREASADFLSAAIAPAAASLGERVGDVIDRYKLLQEIGQGGMGSVWMAEQREPVVRKVALKIIKLGLDTREVIVRFEAERQALALMEHPHIAKVLDGGATSSGRPYFVMELVRGVPITEYCDKARLGLRERLELFTKVCEAIQHAHHKGVIHRDIKPSNVLVTLHDGVAVPKVIDFGIAKATSAELTKKTLFTQFAQILGTPEYMAPEQAEMSGLDIDTRADVYSLGVLLYELLTGTKPFDLRTAMQAGFQELLRTIREDEPMRPSTRVSTAGQGASPIAAHRQLNVESWSARLRGDLDWIVMRALEKDRSRRYDTPNGFAEDIGRYLRDEPVVAAPPGAAYRFTKFVRRRRKTVVSAALLLLALVAGLAGTSYGLLKARESAEAERIAKEVAERNLDFARKGNQILGQVFSGLSSDRNYETLGEFRSALRAGLDDAVTALDGSSIGDPLEVAHLQKRLALSLTSLGEHRAAIELFERGLETFERELGATHVDTLSTAQSLASALLSAGELERALAMLETNLAHARQTLGAEHDHTLDALVSYGEGLHVVGRSKEAVSVFEEALPKLETQRGPDARATILCMSNLASAKAKLDHTEESIALYESALERARRTLGAEHPETVGLQDNLATAYQQRGELARATPLLEATLNSLRSRLGNDHPKTLAATNNLAVAYHAAGRLQDAEPLLEAVLANHEAEHGADHPHSLVAANNLAAIYFRNGKNDKAIPLLEKTLRVQRTKLAPDHPDLLFTMGNLASGYWRASRLDESIPLFEQVYEAQRNKLGPDHQVTRSTAANLATNYKSAGRYAESLPYFVAAHEVAARVPTLRGYTAELLEVYLRLDKREEAELLFEEVLAHARAGAPNGGEKLASALTRLGQLWLEFGAAAHAEPVLAESLEIREQLEPDAWTTFAARSSYGAALFARDAFAQAEPYLTAAATGLLEREASIPAPSLPRIDAALERVVDLYTRWDAVAPDDTRSAQLDEWRARLQQRTRR